MFRIKTIVNLLSLKRLSNLFNVDLRSRSSKPLQASYSEAIDIIQKYQRRRFISLSAGGGGGQWPDIKQITKKKKEKQGRPSNPNWILRDMDVTLNSLAAKKQSKSVIIGFVEEGPRPPDPLRFSQSRLSVVQLAEILSIKRPLIDTPPRRVLNKVRVILQEGYNATVEESKR